MGADWVGLNDKITTLVGSASASRESGALWQTFHSQYEADMSQVKHDGWVFDNFQELQDYVSNTKDAAQKSYDSFLSTWQSNFADDAAYMYSLHSIAVTTWEQKVHHPLRQESYQTRDSKVLNSWTGPGAEKYAGVVTKQASAMDEVLTMVQTAGQAITAALNNIQGIALALYNYASKAKDQLSGWEVDPSKDGFGVRTHYGAQVFKSLDDWVSKMANYGDWISNIQTQSDACDDALVQSTSFADGHWPKAVVKDIGDMKNGNSGLGDKTKQQGGPGSKTGTPATPPGGTQSGGVDGPEQVDPGQTGGKEGGEPIDLAADVF